MAGFRTKLTLQGPAPQDYEREIVPAGARAVAYESAGKKLKAWFALPAAAGATTKVPAVVYFHGGFAFGASDFDDARPFLNAGFAVLCPTLRGENGNPGNFELFLGEVDDGIAAISWLAKQPEVDVARIYTFGHSAGGVVSALLSLRDVPIRHGGSAGGLYNASLFEALGDVVPFNRGDARETGMRMLVGNMRWMKHRHYAFIGADDDMAALATAREQSQRLHAPLAIKVLPGNHLTSLRPAVEDYISKIRTSP